MASCFRLRTLALADIILGILVFAFQMTLIVGYKNDYSKHFQTGVWIGLILFGTGLAALRILNPINSTRTGWRLTFLSVLVSLIASVVLIVVASIAIHAWYWVTWYWYEVRVIRTLNGFLILFGFVGFVTNIFLAFELRRVSTSHMFQLPLHK